MWLLLASAIRAFTYLHHGVLLPPIAETKKDSSFSTQAPQQWDPILHCDAHTSNFFVHFVSSTSPPNVMIADFSRSRQQSKRPSVITDVLTVQDDLSSFLSSIGTSPPLSGEFPPQVQAEIQALLGHLKAGVGALDLVKDGTYMELIKRHRDIGVRLVKPRIDKNVPVRMRGESRRDKLKWRDARDELDEMKVEWSWVEVG